MIRHFLTEYVMTGFGPIDRTIEVPSRDINEIAKCVKLYGPTTYKLVLFDVDVYEFFIDGKWQSNMGLQFNIGQFNIETYSLGTQYQPGHIRLKTGATRAIGADEKILPPDMFQYRDKESNKKSFDESE